jgi:hypothetical protein
MTPDLLQSSIQLVFINNFIELVRDTFIIAVLINHIRLYTAIFVRKNATLFTKEIGYATDTKFVE